MSTEQKYPGYEELTSYLTRHKKSFWGFLLCHRNIIVTTTSVTSRRQDLEGDWVRNFLLEARKLGENLEEMVDSERRRRAKDFENYWNNVISECKIKKDILDHEAEISRLKRKLSEIQENAKIQNPSNQEDLVNEGPDDHGILIFDDGDDNDDNGNIDNVGEDNEDPDDHDILMFDDGDDNINNDDNGNIDNIGEDNDTISSSSPAVLTTSTTTTNNNSNDNTTVSSSSPAIATTTPPPYNLRTRRPNPPSYNCGRVTKKYRKKNTPLLQPRPSRQPSRQPSPRQLSPRRLSPRRLSPRRPSPRQPSPPHDDFDFFDNGSGGEDDNNKCTGGCPEHCGDAYRGDD